MGFDEKMCEGDFVAEGYENGVPMGGDLPKKPGDKETPTFILAGWQDFTPLEQIHIIKGWVDGEGKSHEKVYRVAGVPGDPTEPEININPNTCEPVGDVGFKQLCSVWKDPDFDAAEKAFYYVN